MTFLYAVPELIEYDICCCNDTLNVILHRRGIMVYCCTRYFKQAKDEGSVQYTERRYWLVFADVMNWGTRKWTIFARRVADSLSCSQLLQLNYMTLYGNILRNVCFTHTLKHYNTQRIPMLHASGPWPITISFSLGLILRYRFCRWP